MAKLKLPRKPPHPGDLIALIRKLAREGKITYTRHAEQERMPERGFDFTDVETILRVGEISGGITPGESGGEWQCLVIGKPELNARDAGVAIVVDRARRIIVKTVEWIDP